MYMQDYDVYNDREGIGPPAVFATATSNETKHDKHPITAQEFTHKEVKDSYYRQASSIIGLPGSTLNFNRNEFLVRSTTIDWGVQKIVPTSLQPHIYITRII